MARLADCETTRELLTALVEGWLDTPGARMVMDHLESCDACRRDLQREEALVRRLADLPAPEVAAPAWSGERRPQPTRLRLAFAAVTALLLVVAWHLVPLPSAQSVAVESSDDSWSQAHYAMSLGDYGLDPNRAIVLARVDMEATR